MAVNSNLNLLHIVKDEKFPDSAYEFFEAVAPGQNTYLLANTNKPIRNLKKITPTRVSPFSYLNPLFIRSLSKYDAIIFHSLYDFTLEVLGRIDPTIPVVWIGMGYDYYDLLIDSRWDLLKPKTENLVRSIIPNYANNKPNHPFKRLLKPFIYPNHQNKKKLLPKINLFAPVLKNEYLQLQNRLKNTLPQFVNWNYGNVADLVDGKLEMNKNTGQDILVGNSATPTNNHLETFQLLAEVGIPNDARVVVPLSYGNNDYRSKILAEGRRYFGDSFCPITETLPFEEYVQVLMGCSTVIMNHLRQQAAGSIVISLFLGARVYMDPQSPLYTEFRDLGLTISPLNDLTNRSSLETQLDSASIEKNRELLRATRGRSQNEYNTYQLIQMIRTLNSQTA